MESVEGILQTVNGQEVMTAGGVDSSVISLGLTRPDRGFSSAIVSVLLALVFITMLLSLRPRNRNPSADKPSPSSGSGPFPPPPAVGPD